MIVFSKKMCIFAKTFGYSTICDTNKETKIEP